MRLVLCGSALAVMSGLLSGRQPLRGRATIEMRLSPFDFREAGEFWGATDHETAFRLHALFGGTPGYRPLVAPPPAEKARLGQWLAGNVLSPGHALFREDEYVLREDPRVTDDGLYLAVLRALAEGATTQSQVAARLGRPRESLNHALEVLLGAALASRRDDLFRQRRPTLAVADPLVRFIQLVVAPNRPLLEEGAAAAVWASAQATVHSQIEGPHFEELARIWVRRYAAEASTGGPVNAVGSAVIDDPASRRTHEIDVIALAHSPNGTKTITLVGDAKATSEARGIRDLVRLEHLRALLNAQRRHAEGAKLALFARSGFTTGLRNLADQRPEIELIDLARLYEGS